MPELRNSSPFEPLGAAACAAPAGASPAVHILLQGMSAIFGFLGREFVCLDRDFKIVHTSEGFDELVGKESAGGLAGRPVEQVLGAELLGPDGTLRLALEAGERREGWGAEVRTAAGAARLLSITVAPVDLARLPGCDAQVAYLAVVRPAEDGPETGSEPPMAFAGMVARSQPRVVPIEIPPLRQRREDIEPLARHLLQRVLARHARALRLAPQALRALLGHHWPGNVRELENALEYAVAVCQGQTIHAEDLPAEVSGPTAARSARTAVAASAIPRGGEEVEREPLLAALQVHRWRRDQAAHALGISRTTLWRRMRELHLDARSAGPAAVSSGDSTLQHAVAGGLGESPVSHPSY